MTFRHIILIAILSVPSLVRAGNLPQDNKKEDNKNRHVLSVKSSPAYFFAYFAAFTSLLKLLEFA